MNDRLEQKFGEETVGLVTKAEFAEKRRTLAARLAVSLEGEGRLSLAVACFGCCCRLNVLTVF